MYILYINYSAYGINKHQDLNIEIIMAEVDRKLENYLHKLSVHPFRIAKMNAYASILI